jgi:hypothetical protein
VILLRRTPATGAADTGGAASPETVPEDGEYTLQVTDFSGSGNDLIDFVRGQILP